MQLLGPLYVISNPPHQILIDPADLDDLRVAVRHAVEATALDPAKVEHAAVHRAGPDVFGIDHVVHPSRVSDLRGQDSSRRTGDISRR